MNEQIMLEFLKAVVLGLAEGVTEFLPISSTGHLIIINQWVVFEESFTKMFDVIIQSGAILAVVVLFWDRLWPWGQTPEKRREVLDIWKKTFVGVLPALLLGFLFGKVIEEKLFNPIVVATMLIVGGILLLLVERKTLSHRIGSIREMNYGVVLLIGLVQCVAMIPGTSRSAATIIGGMLLGLSRVTAAEFSFFLAVPTMAAASGYTILSNEVPLGLPELGFLFVGFIVSFLTAWAVIKVFLRYIQKNNFQLFGYYRITLGMLVILLLKM
jgi:undecaprenyl-diphosphatase